VQSISSGKHRWREGHINPTEQVLILFALSGKFWIRYFITLLIGDKFL
jgi:hypothetical protein